MSSWLEENFPDLYNSGNSEPKTNRTDVTDMAQEIRRYYNFNLSEEDRRLNSLWFSSGGNVRYQSAVRPRPEAVLGHHMENFLKNYGNKEYEDAADCHVRYGDFPDFAFDLGSISPNFITQWNRFSSTRMYTVTPATGEFKKYFIFYVVDHADWFGCLAEDGRYFLNDCKYEYVNRKACGFLNRIHFLKYDIATHLKEKENKR